MVTPNKKTKLTIVVITVAAIILVIILIMFLIIIKNPTSSSCIEKQKLYKVTLNGAEILAFNSVPKKIVKSLKKYIKDNGYNGKDFMFVFENSPATPLIGKPYPNDFYYIYQNKRNSGNIDYKYNRHNIYIGNMTIDKEGNVVETQHLMTADELSKIKTEPSISFIEALQMARAYLNLDENSLAEIWTWCFCTPHNDDEWILCFQIKLRDNDKTVYIDGFTGEIIE